MRVYGGFRASDSMFLWWRARSLYVVFRKDVYVEGVLGGVVVVVVVHKVFMRWVFFRILLLAILASILVRRLRMVVVMFQFTLPLVTTSP